MNLIYQGTYTHPKCKIIIKGVVTKEALRILWQCGYGVIKTAKELEEK